MVPLLTALALALCAGAIAYAALSITDRPHTARRVRDDAPPPSRFAAAFGAVVGLLLLAVVLGGLAEVAEGNTVVSRWDERVERWAADHAGPLGTDALRIATHIGDTVTVVVVAAICVVALLRAGHRRLALFVTTVVLGQWLIANLTKELVQRARPQLDPLSSFSGFSFPSGHTTAAAATYLALAFVAIALRPRWRRRVLVSGAVTVAVLVAASRALLGVHWFSDVIGGLLLGWAWCVICAVLYGVFKRRPSWSESMSTTTSSPSAT
jgi:undecaprenyl-diphosphatase